MMNYSIFIAPQLYDEVIHMETIGAGPDPALLRAEVAALKQGHIILHAPPYLLMVCSLGGRPALRQELGRQREIAFRQVGESTGQAYDTDSFDDYYEQLIIWDDVAQCLVGGYRFGCGDRIHALYGKQGFYISRFFDIDPAFDAYLPECLELGRSFIVPEYQKKNLPLYLLWKGIMTWMVRHPQYKYLIGLVSISRHYSDFSRKVLMEYVRRHFYHPVFARWFTPRIPFHPVITDADKKEIRQWLGAPPDIEEIVDRLQPEHIQFPVLMRQYIRQNARFLGFNLDPDFNNALDGLMILDMADVPASTVGLLQRE